MKKACPYCGKIHDKKYTCEQARIIKQQRDREQFKRNQANRTFRSSSLWTDKAKAIRERDLNLCRICMAEGKYTPADSVHHIRKLKDDFEKRLDDDNLISLCTYHHKLADSGAYSESYLQSLANTPPYPDE